MKYWIGWMVLFLLAAVCIWQGYGILSDSGQTLLYFKGEGITQKQIETLEKASPELSAWYGEKNVEVSNKDIGKVQMADCKLVYGNRERAAYYGLDSGTYGYRGDEGGCIISRGLSMEIFGTVSAAGQELWCRGERYIVRGVTAAPGYLIQIPSKLKEDERFLYVVLADQGGDGLGSDVDQMLFSRGISKDYAKAEGKLYLSAASLCLLIPVWTMTGCGLYLFFRKREWEWGRLTAIGLFFCLSVISILFLNRIGFGISQEMIPDKWSNFTFLSDAIKNSAANLIQAGEMYDIPWVEMISRRLNLLAMVSLSLSMGVAAFTFRFSFDT